MNGPLDPDPPNGPCALCGHVPSCGFAMVGELYLCHADDHSCYHAWTVWGKRVVLMSSGDVDVHAPERRMRP